MTKSTHPRNVLPVMHEFRISRGSEPLLTDFLGSFRFGLLVTTLLVLWIGMDAAAAQDANGGSSVWAAILKWSPLMFWGDGQGIGGFTLNIVVSCLAMALGTVLGLLVGVARVSPRRLVRTGSWAITQLFRNSPWLVILFYFMLLIPYQFNVAGTTFAVPPWIKATLALSLPIMANVAEIVRGAIASVPTGQWESAESLAFSRRQILWRIILPQCVKRMIPPWMNWYCILMMSTPLISILGVQDAMTLTQDALTAEARREYLIPFYLWLMLWFFLYTYPIAWMTRRLEARFAEKG